MPPETGHRILPVTKGSAGHLFNLPKLRSPEEGLGCLDNRHLNGLIESSIMNVRGCPETDVPSSRGEKPGQRRYRHSSRRSGEPATGRRAAGVWHSRISSTVALAWPEISHCLQSSFGERSPLEGAADGKSLCCPP